MTQADLHIHSNHSDGSDSVKELITKIKETGIDVFALSDHDNIAGCAEAESYVSGNLKFIPAIELTCKTKDLSCHILGYNCDYKNPVLLKLIEKGKGLRRKKLDMRIDYLKEVWGIILTDKEKDWLYSRHSVVKTHVANILMQRGLAKDNISAMKKYLDDCKTGNTKFLIEESVDAILKSGGIPIMAHPLGGEGEIHLSETEFIQRLEKMIGFGIQGLECYYSRYNEKEITFLAELSKRHNLLISGGSDYHGTNKDIPLGKLNTDNVKINTDKLTVLNRIL